MTQVSDIKTVLVTGGAGFVGSHTVEALSESGYDVRVMGTGTGDVCRKEDWRKTLKGVDAVIHLAAYMDSHPDISRYTHTNVESIALAFEVMREEKISIKSFTLASSQILYGEGKYSCPTHGIVFPFPRTTEQLAAHDWEPRCPSCASSIEPLPTQESDPTSPQSAYALSKLAAEQLLLFLGKTYGVPCTVLRYAAVIGDRRSSKQRFPGAVGAFVSDAMKEEPIRLNEDGQQLRDFVHVRDIAAAHALVLGNAAAQGRIFNVGSGQGTHVLDLAKTVAETAGTPFVPQLTGRASVDAPRHALMDIAEIGRLGYRPRYSLKEMVYDYLQSV